DFYCQVWDGSNVF
nr:immunoglobulin light chain junction region [Macaca mulatta]MOW02156.1 immunoglobulin light chain junction region [Macaca mulatta]MOW02239.1 immunoglobulin light chain junction region [Macaca mulatta]MOW02349.1 immunoglobulin light chain junction region [Macaca mulatta]MOW02603.1 immunoglobulin light chain junction region [Macaca mulatta]